MAWFWTDDLARALVEGGLVAGDAVEEWMSRPVAVAGPDDLDHLAMGRMLLDDARAGVA